MSEWLPELLRGEPRVIISFGEGTIGEPKLNEQPGPLYVVGDELASADAPFREATSPEAGNTPDSGRRSDSSTPAGDASADVVDELEADVDAGDVADAGLCCSVTGAPACTGGCSFPCTLCVAGGACSHVYQGVNYAGQVTACP